MFPQTLEKLALGGLLHDVGLKELPRELLEKSRHLMSAEEVQTYETHVYRGVEILQSMPSVPEEVIAMLFEHHENAIGQGYPRKLRDFKMNPLAKVVALADAFADMTLKNPQNSNIKTPEEAINYIEVTLGQPYNKPTFAALKQVLNMKSGKPLRKSG
jgi:HD-GYP domain-containing protein (c-di-GMP phosphodiesterase class II)